MKKLSLLITGLTIGLFSIAQNEHNLVPNPSFEETVSCPTGANEYPLSCVAWNMVSQAGSSGATWLHRGHQLL